MLAVGAHRVAARGRGAPALPAAARDVDRGAAHRGRARRVRATGRASRELRDLHAAGDGRGGRARVTRARPSSGRCRGRGRDARRSRPAPRTLLPVVYLAVEAARAARRRRGRSVGFSLPIAARRRCGSAPRQLFYWTVLGNGSYVGRRDRVDARASSIVRADDARLGGVQPARSCGRCRVRGARAACSRRRRRHQHRPVALARCRPRSRWRSGCGSSVTTTCSSSRRSRPARGDRAESRVGAGASRSPRSRSRPSSRSMFSAAGLLHEAVRCRNRSTRRSAATSPRTPTPTTACSCGATCPRSTGRRDACPRRASSRRTRLLAGNHPGRAGGRRTRGVRPAECGLVLPATSRRTRRATSSTPSPARDPRRRAAHRSTEFPRLERYARAAVPLLAHDRRHRHLRRDYLRSLYRADGSDHDLRPS